MKRSRLPGHAFIAAESKFALFLAAVVVVVDAQISDVYHAFLSSLEMERSPGPGGLRRPSKRLR